MVQSSASGTHHGLHLVRFSLMGSRLPPSLSQSSPIPKKESRPPVGSVSASAFASPIPQDATSIVERLLTGCLMAKAPCVMDGKTPLLSLVDVEVLVETTDVNHSNNNNKNHSHSSTSLKTSPRPNPRPDPSSGPSPSPGAVVKVSQEVPVKFTKYMRRESILHTRLTSHDQQAQQAQLTVTHSEPTSTTSTTAASTVAATTATTATTTATEATFMGLRLLVPTDALRPRPSR